MDLPTGLPAIVVATDMLDHGGARERGVGVELLEAWLRAWRRVEAEA